MRKLIVTLVLLMGGVAAVVVVINLLPSGVRDSMRNAAETLVEAVLPDSRAGAVLPSGPTGATAGSTSLTITMRGDSGKLTDYVLAKDGDEVEICLHYTNTGSATAKDVNLLANLSSELKLITGSTTVGNTAAADIVGRDGVNIGTFEAGGGVEVRFRVKVELKDKAAKVRVDAVIASQQGNNYMVNFLTTTLGQ